MTGRKKILIGQNISGAQQGTIRVQLTLDLDTLNEIAQLEDLRSEMGQYRYKFIARATEMADVSLDPRQISPYAMPDYPGNDFERWGNAASTTLVFSLSHGYYRPNQQ